jgi:type I restriction enzyme R subunit
MARTVTFLVRITGKEARFISRLDPVPRSRNVFAFHRPEALLAWLENDAPSSAAQTPAGVRQPQIPAGMSEIGIIKV